MVHGTRLAGFKVPAALVEIGIRGQRAAAERDRRGRQRGGLARQDRDGARDQTRAKQAHLSVPAGRDPARRAIWMTDAADAPLVHATTTPSPATASAG